MTTILPALLGITGYAAGAGFTYRLFRAMALLDEDRWTAADWALGIVMACLWPVCLPLTLLGYAVIRHYHDN